MVDGTFVKKHLINLFVSSWIPDGERVLNAIE